MFYDFLEGIGGEEDIVSDVTFELIVQTIAHFLAASGIIFTQSFAGKYPEELH